MTVETDSLRVLSSEDFFKKATLQERAFFLLKYAILAPSTHNSQPWLFNVSDDGLCMIYADLSKYLPEGDKDRRDMFLSVGCAIENFRTATLYFNAFDAISFFNSKPENNRQLIAELRIKHSVAPSNDESIKRRFEAITKRVNARGMFENAPITPAVRVALDMIELEDGVSVYVADSDADKKTIAELTAEGLRFAHSSKSFRKELSLWVRDLGRSKPDGIPWYGLKVPFPVSLFIAEFLRAFNMSSVLAPLNEKSIISASRAVIFLSKNDSFEDWIKVGMSAERMMLEAWAHGLKTSVFVAAIEMPELRKQLREFLKTDLLPQFHFVIGFMDEKFKFTSRHPVEAKLI